MYLDKLRPDIGQGFDPFEMTYQLGGQGYQEGMQAKNRVEQANARAMQDHMQEVQRQQQEEQQGLGSLANIGLAFATGGTSAGLGALAGEAIGGPLGDIAGMALGKKFGGGQAASTAGNALTSDIGGSALDTFATPDVWNDYLRGRQRWF